MWARTVIGNDYYDLPRHEIILYWNKIEKYTCSRSGPTTQKICHYWLQYVHSIIVIFSTGNGIPNTLQTCGDAFVLSSWRHEGGKHAMNTLDYRYTLVEHGVETSHTSWEQVDVRLARRYAFTHVMKSLGERYPYGLTRWSAAFEAFNTRVKHAGEWLTDTHVRVWTCCWFSHTMFTRSCHASRCDCALIRVLYGAGFTSRSENVALLKGCERLGKVWPTNVLMKYSNVTILLLFLLPRARL